MRRCSATPRRRSRRRSRSPRRSAVGHQSPPMCEPALAGERSFFRAPRRTHDEHAHRYPRLKPWATILTPASPTDTTLTFMSRYIKKFRSTTALGPTEERGVPLWVGYDIDGVDDDLSDFGLL